MGGQHGFHFTSTDVALARPIYLALALYGVNAKQEHVLTAAQGPFLADTKDLYKAFLEESVQQDQDAPPMSHNDFLVACVDAIFNLVVQEQREVRFVLNFV